MVRKIACLSIHLIAELCNSNNISRLLVTYKNFTEDTQKFVKNSALEVIGYFTNVLPRENKNARFILDFYIKSLENFYSSHEVATQADNETFYHSAFNFPAVLYYFGKESWPELRQIYIKMSSDKYYKVRKSLASSINEIANIIGKKDTDQYLIPIFDRFYREEGEIQRAIYKSMPKFLININQEKRIAYLEKLKKMMTGREKWRIKKECVDILGNLGGVFDDTIAYEQIFPICIKFCVDEVAEVRIHSMRSMKSLVIQFLNNSQFKEKILEIIIAFATSLKYNFRNLFLHLIEELIPTDKAIIIEYFMKYLELLSRDKVINIQIHMAKIIQMMVESNLYNDCEVLRTMFLKVNLNQCKQVQEHLLKIPKDLFKWNDPNEEKLVKNIENSNSLFTNRMEILVESKIVPIVPGFKSINRVNIIQPNNMQHIQNLNKTITLKEKVVDIKELSKENKALNNEIDNQLEKVGKLIKEADEQSLSKLQNNNASSSVDDLYHSDEQQNLISAKNLSPELTFAEPKPDSTLDQISNNLEGNENNENNNINSINSEETFVAANNNPSSLNTIEHANSTYEENHKEQQEN